MIFFRNNPNFADDSGDGPFTTKQFAEEMSSNVVVRDPLLRDPFDQVSPDEGWTNFEPN